jgi:restriction endonuclease Mrr
MAKKAKSSGSKSTSPSGSNGKPEAPANGESVSSYFRKIFKENPTLLNSTSNDELLRHWLADHPDSTEVPKNVKANLSTIKSVLRSKSRKKKAKAVKVAASAPAAAKVAVSTPVVTKVAAPTVPATSKLEKLEEQIDDCLTAARTLDPEGLENVILHLRKARSAVVWKMGL